MALLGGEMLSDAQSLSEIDEALAVPLVRLDDFPVGPRLKIQIATMRLLEDLWRRARGSCA